MSGEKPKKTIGDRLTGLLDPQAVAMQRRREEMERAELARVQAVALMERGKRDAEREEAREEKEKHAGYEPKTICTGGGYARWGIIIIMAKRKRSCYWWTWQGSK